MINGVRLIAQQAHSHSHSSGLSSQRNLNASRDLQKAGVLYDVLCSKAPKLLQDRFTHVSPSLHLLDCPGGHELRRLKGPRGGDGLAGLLLLLDQLRVHHREPEAVAVLLLRDGQQALNGWGGDSIGFLSD